MGLALFRPCTLLNIPTLKSVILSIKLISLDNMAIFDLNGKNDLVLIRTVYRFYEVIVFLIKFSDNIPQIGLYNWLTLQYP